jgi:hypothetical protein
VSPRPHWCFLGTRKTIRRQSTSIRPKLERMLGIWYPLQAGEVLFRQGFRSAIVRRMAITALAVDNTNTHHLLIGLNRENVESTLRGDVFTLPKGAAPLTVDSDIVIIFAETNEDLGQTVSATSNRFLNGF